MQIICQRDDILTGQELKEGNEEEDEEEQEKEKKQKLQ